MSETLTALASENLNPGLSSLLQDVQRGNIRVPRFQRPFVWRDEQRLLLLESIRENMPIGSLLLWRTAKMQLACFDQIGPHHIPPPAQSALTVGWQYLLDGHQRVSTLLSLLIPPDTQRDASLQTEDDAGIDWDIQYDLMHQEFVFTNDLEPVFPKPPLLPLWTLFDGRLVNKQMREMRKQIEQQGWPESEFDEWEVRADQLAYRFQQYRIPILVMTTENLDLAARTFQRINSQGTPMGEAHLVAALTWSPDFNLREKLDVFRQELPQPWRNLDDKLFLQVCKGLISSDIRSVKEDRLVLAIRQDKDLLPRAAEGVMQAVDLLISKAGVLREDLLPYSMQLVFLACELVRRKGKTIPETAFIKWFWRTCWSEAFGGASWRIKAEQEILGRIDADHLQVPGNARNDWDASKIFDSRYARNRTWMLRVAQRTDLVDGYGNAVNGSDLLEKYGKDAFVKLLPEPVNASARLKFLLRTPGNRFLLEPKSVSVLRQCLTGAMPVPATILYPHFIDQSELAMLRAGNDEGFLVQRNIRITKWMAGEFGKAT